MKFTRVKINNFYNLKNVDLDLTEGNALIVGPNGSGKSNIIKCIDFLVQRILGTRSTNAKIWDVNSPQSFIEVYAVFCRAEVEFLSNIRLWFLLCDVCDIITFIIAILENLLVGHELLTRCKGKLSFWVDEFHKENIFRDLPKERLRALFTYGNVGSTGHDGNFNFLKDRISYDAQSTHPDVGRLIQETLDKLFPKLLKITQEAMASAGRSRPKEGSDVFMWVRTADPGTPGYLKHSHNIVDDVWLPAAREEESKAIWTSLKDIFGDHLYGITVTLEGLHGRNASTNTSLQSLISNLVNLKRFDSPQLQCSGTGHDNRQNRTWNYLGTDDMQNRTWFLRTGGSSRSRDCADIMRKSPVVMRWLSRCLQGHSEVDKICSTEKQSFVEGITKKFLESSLCILPQNRGLFAQGSRVSLDANKVEQMLIWHSLSTEEEKQRQYKIVVDALKSFCGLDIQVREKTFHQTCEQNAQAIKRIGDKLLDSHGTSSLDVSKDLNELAKQITKQSQSSSSSLQVLVTRTMQYEDSIYNIATQLSDLSGGEIELLMVFCAVHLSRADTVLLDEPGHSLHPPQQAQLRRWLETQRPKDQVLLAISHSTEFISLQTLCCLYHMSFEGQGYTPFRLVIRGHGARSLGAKLASDREVVSVMGRESQVSGSQDNASAVSSQSQSEVASVAPPSSETTSEEVIFSQEVVTLLMRPNMRKMFFATGLYFVEGETDERVLTALRHCMMAEASTISDAATTREEDSISEKLTKARKVMKVREMDHWEILPLHGCGNAVKAYKIAQELKIPCAVVLDGDTITVKQKGKIQPFNSVNWKRSTLQGQLSKVADFLPDVKTLLKEVKGVFGKEPAQVVKAFAKHGFWIWDRSDLEQALVANHEARQKIHEFFVPLESKEGEPNVHGALGSQKGPRLQMKATELSGSKRKGAHPPHSTQEPTAIPNKRSKTTHSGVIESTPSQQQTNSNAATKMDHRSTSETQKSISVDQVRRELHDHGGWKKIPWEILLAVVRICLKDERNPFVHFCEFMLQWQSKGKKKKTQLPEDLLSIVFRDID